MNLDYLLELTRKFEAVYQVDNYKGNRKLKTPFAVTKGYIPILLSAPHTTYHFRENSDKLPEPYTGAIGSIVQSITGCHFISMARYDKEDSNYLEDTLYKQEVKKIIQEQNIKYVIDLHGASIKHEFDIDLGTNLGNSIKKEIIDELKEIFQMNNIIDVRENDTFKADKKGTLTYYCSEELGVPAVQMEFNRRFRSPETDIVSFAKLIFSLIQIVQYLNEEK